MVHAAVSSAAIDDYLARGWFRFGGTMRTTRFTVWEERDLRTTLWTRTNLEGFRWSKSNRRLINRVRRSYRVEINPLTLDEEREDLYRRYIEHVGGERPRNLIDFLGGVDRIPCFDTREITIWDDDVLVAYSFFDEGENSLMSLLGVFDPDYSDASLGYATLALEVEHARQRNLGYHYSGYVLPGEPRMDYKLRVGGMEYLDPDHHHWHPWSELDTEALPDRRLHAALSRVSRALQRYGIRSVTRLNPLFEIADSPAIQERMVDQPAYLMVGRSDMLPIVVWDDEARLYHLAMGAPAVIRHRRSEEGPERNTGTALLYDELGRYGLASDVVSALLQVREAR